MGVVLALPVMHILLFVCEVSMLRECEGAMGRQLLVWESGGGVSIWVVHMVQVLCLVQMTCKR